MPLYNVPYKLLQSLYLLKYVMNFIHGDGFTVEIVRSSKRKSISIKISKGKAFINVPDYLTHCTIESIIAKKQQWIKTKIALQENLKTQKPKQFFDGETFLYFGQNYTLKITLGVFSSVNIENDKLIVNVKERYLSDTNAIKKLLARWYSKQAEIILKEKTEYYAKLIGVNPTSVTIKTFKSRWGSCNINAGIQYNWKIIMAPETIINYLVIHELCHIHHHNHSPKYWQTVEKYCPQYKDHGKWLKQNGAYLEL